MYTLCHWVCALCVMVHFHCPTVIPIPDIVPIPIVCRSAPLGLIPMVIPMQITEKLTSLLEKLIVVSIDPLLACLVIPTTGLYNNFHSFRK